MTEYNNSIPLHTIASAPSARSLLTMSKPALRSTTPLMISTTAFNHYSIRFFIADKFQMDRKTEMKTLAFLNESIKELE